ncbi:cell division protein FtsQ/DivIB [Thalassococcus sp. S3]|uniref:cell division protein FtsQ/DivIB n=1 Tax=Thalassococcus sp. S3 TaxID=2017482 RepID=UPI0010242736|nr:cell division protein FtsQ/DivIB [Thalassococcus sp. S3]QBF31255.1 cell division protein FtsQ [Thalassococcus sp. S3]
MQQVEHRPDPAPSRLHYRMQRWMLTPGIRLMLRAGLPFCITFLLASAWLANEENRDRINLAFVDLKASIQERPEFMVNLMAIDGAGRDVSEDIREVLPLDFPISSFDLDLENVRNTITGLDPVRDASVRIRPGGVLQIDVTERVPALLWRTRDGLEVLDPEGVHVGMVPHRAERPDLPLIAGDGADGHVEEAIAIFAAAEPLGSRLRGLVRIGERRWDVVLDRNQRILLPEDGAVQALERVITLSEADDMLERDVAVVDMRLSARPTLQMTDAALKDWWRIRAINGGGQ